MRAVRILVMITVGAGWSTACGSSDPTHSGTGGSSGSSGSDGAAGGGTAGTAATGGAAAASGAAGSAGVAGSTPDASLDAEVDAGLDAAVDAALDVAVDTGADVQVEAAPDGPTGPNVCGDGWRDPLTEECDDGNGSTPPDSCAADCRVTDLLALPMTIPEGGLPPTVRRTLGQGEHPLAAGDSGFATVFVNYTQQPPTIQMKLFDPKGAPVPGVIDLASGPTQVTSADPVVAALPGNKYAVAWRDVSADGDAAGVAMTVVNGATQTVGPITHANDVVAKSQYHPDILWTGQELVVVWRDESAGTGPTNVADIRGRLFTATGAPKGGQFDVATSTVTEFEPSLCAFAGSWAAAWRQVASGGLERVGVRAASGVQWLVGPVGTPPTGDRPAMVALDSQRLLVVFSGAQTVAGNYIPRLQGAILDLAHPGQTQHFPIPPTVAAYADIEQGHPALARVGNRIYLAWRSEAIIASAEAEELWLKELTWHEGTYTLDLSLGEITLPRDDAHRKGNQRYPALAAAPLWPEGALVTAWNDHGRVFGSIEGTPDFLVEFIPTPVLRLPDPVDGGGG